ncbi:hypothetical protein AYI68_g8173 [Smittium mucronatum]|uniref:GDP/GTP exchange factor Sec2 N-terminal domain-containing protein n=1 Tax=Smittium mucronatum TaxID=133383 RepID=A0A1R0GLM9_9FUNG|nr:hypothetical protein AYI68_g8173 [Smittium mucronatum]
MEAGGDRISDSDSDKEFYVNSENQLHSFFNSSPISHINFKPHNSTEKSQNLQRISFMGAKSLPDSSDINLYSKSNRFDFNFPLPGSSVTKDLSVMNSQSPRQIDSAPVSNTDYKKTISNNTHSNLDAYKLTYSQNSNYRLPNKTKSILKNGSNRNKTSIDVVPLESLLKKDSNKYKNEIGNSQTANFQQIKISNNSRKEFSPSYNLYDFSNNENTNHGSILTDEREFFQKNQVLRSSSVGDLSRPLIIPQEFDLSHFHSQKSQNELINQYEQSYQSHNFIRSNSKSFISESDQFAQNISPLSPVIRLINEVSQISNDHGLSMNRHERSKSEPQSLPVELIIPDFENKNFDSKIIENSHISSRPKSSHGGRKLSKSSGGIKIKKSEKRVEAKLVPGKVFDAQPLDNAIEALKSTSPLKSALRNPSSAIKNQSKLIEKSRTRYSAENKKVTSSESQNFTCEKDISSGKSSTQIYEPIVLNSPKNEDNLAGSFRDYKSQTLFENTSPIFSGESKSPQNYQYITPSPTLNFFARSSNNRNNASKSSSPQNKKSLSPIQSSNFSNTLIINTAESKNSPVKKSSKILPTLPISSRLKDQLYSSNSKVYSITDQISPGISPVKSNSDSNFEKMLMSVTLALKDDYFPSEIQENSINSNSLKPSLKQPSLYEKDSISKNGRNVSALNTSVSFNSTQENSHSPNVIKKPIYPLNSSEKIFSKSYSSKNVNPPPSFSSNSKEIFVDTYPFSSERNFLPLDVKDTQNSNSINKISSSISEPLSKSKASSSSDLCGISEKKLLPPKNNSTSTIGLASKVVTPRTFNSIETKVTKSKNMASIFESSENKINTPENSHFKLQSSFEDLNAPTLEGKKHQLKSSSNQDTQFNESLNLGDSELSITSGIPFESKNEYKAPNIQSVKIIDISLRDYGSDTPSSYPDYEQIGSGLSENEDIHSYKSIPEVIEKEINISSKVKDDAYFTYSLNNNSINVAQVHHINNLSHSKVKKARDGTFTKSDDINNIDNLDRLQKIHLEALNVSNNSKDQNSQSFFPTQNIPVQTSGDTSTLLISKADEPGIDLVSQNKTIDYKIVIPFEESASLPREDNCQSLSLDTNLSNSSLDIFKSDQKDLSTSNGISLNPNHIHPCAPSFKNSSEEGLISLEKIDEPSNLSISHVHTNKTSDIESLSKFDQSFTDSAEESEQYYLANEVILTKINSNNESSSSRLIPPIIASEISKSSVEKDSLDFSRSNYSIASFSKKNLVSLKKNSISSLSGYENDSLAFSIENFPRNVLNMTSSSLSLPQSNSNIKNNLIDPKDEFRASSLRNSLISPKEGKSEVYPNLNNIKDVFHPSGNPLNSLNILQKSSGLDHFHLSSNLPEDESDLGRISQELDKSLLMPGITSVISSNIIVGSPEQKNNALLESYGGKDLAKSDSMKKDEIIKVHVPEMDFSFKPFSSLEHSTSLKSSQDLGSHIYPAKNEQDLRLEHTLNSKTKKNSTVTNQKVSPIEESENAGVYLNISPKNYTEAQNYLHENDRNRSQFESSTDLNSSSEFGGPKILDNKRVSEALTESTMGSSQYYESSNLDTNEEFYSIGFRGSYSKSSDEIIQNDSNVSINSIGAKKFTLHGNEETLPRSVFLKNENYSGNFIPISEINAVRSSTQDVSQVNSIPESFSSNDLKDKIGLYLEPPLGEERLQDYNLTSKALPTSKTSNFNEDLDNVPLFDGYTSPSITADLDSSTYDSVNLTSSNRKIITPEASFSYFKPCDYASIPNRPSDALKKLPSTNVSENLFVSSEIAENPERSISPSKCLTNNSGFNSDINPNKITESSFVSKKSSFDIHIIDDFDLETTHKIKLDSNQETSSSSKNLTVICAKKPIFNDFRDDLKLEKVSKNVSSSQIIEPNSILSSSDPNICNPSSPKHIGGSVPNLISFSDRSNNFLFIKTVNSRLEASKNPKDKILKEYQIKNFQGSSTFLSENSLSDTVSSHPDLDPMEAVCLPELSNPSNTRDDIRTQVVEVKNEQILLNPLNSSIIVNSNDNVEVKMETADKASREILDKSDAEVLQFSGNIGESHNSFSSSGGADIIPASTFKDDRKISEHNRDSVTFSSSNSTKSMHDPSGISKLNGCSSFSQFSNIDDNLNSLDHNIFEGVHSQTHSSNVENPQISESNKISNHSSSSSEKSLNIEKNKIFEHNSTNSLDISDKPTNSLPESLSTTPTTKLNDPIPDFNLDNHLEPRATRTFSKKTRGDSDLLSNPPYVHSNSNSLKNESPNINNSGSHMSSNGKNSSINITTKSNEKESPSSVNIDLPIKTPINHPNYNKLISSFPKIDGDDVIKSENIDGVPSEKIALTSTLAKYLESPAKTTPPDIASPNHTPFGSLIKTSMDDGNKDQSLTKIDLLSIAKIHYSSSPLAKSGRTKQESDFEKKKHMSNDYQNFPKLSYKDSESSESQTQAFQEANSYSFKSEEDTSYRFNSFGSAELLNDRQDLTEINSDLADKGLNVKTFSNSSEDGKFKFEIFNRPSSKSFALPSFKTDDIDILNSPVSPDLPKIGKSDSSIQASFSRSKSYSNLKSEAILDNKSSPGYKPLNKGKAHSKKSGGSSNSTILNKLTNMFSIDKNDDLKRVDIDNIDNLTPMEYKKKILHMQKKIDKQTKKLAFLETTILDQQKILDSSMDKIESLMKKNTDIEFEKNNIEDEIEELSKSLFTEANELVKKEAIRRHEAEQKTISLEKEIIELKKQIDSLISSGK